MKNINEYLKEQALIEKRYNGIYVVGSLKPFGVIDYLDECDEKISHELIDLYIADSYCMNNLYSDSPDNYWNNIYETLILSHDAKKLTKCLKLYFNNNMLSYEFINTSVKLNLKKCDDTKQIIDYIQKRKFNRMYDNELTKTLSDILNFFNYFISYCHPIYKDSEFSYFEVLIEPKYSIKSNYLVYNKYNGVLYHITHKDNVQRILKRGLQLKGKNNLYRYIEPRINFFLADTENEIKERASKIANQKNYKKNEYSILKIDLNYERQKINRFTNSSYRIDFYHDNLYDEDWSVYTYGLIHPRFISVKEI